ncbi:MAG: helix-turn-helix domain-containing protein [Opitutales bacterium]|nr:helix-turn-helix domain-containing protein [Opitutales bacterium]
MIQSRPKHRPIQPWIAASKAPDQEMRGLCYREFAPPPGLEDVLLVVWTLTGKSPADKPFPYHVVPDACSDLIFDRQSGEGFIFGTASEAKTVEMKGDIFIVGLRLQPHLLPAFTGIPAFAVRNAEPSFEEASLGSINEIFARHTGEATDQVGLGEVESLARAVVTRLRPERINQRAQWLTSALLDGEGSVDRAAKTTGFSTRQLQRIAQQDMGLSPKRLGRILRLQQAFPVVLENHQCHALIAADYGFADQAHMIREFSTLTGYSPGFWRERKMSDLFNQNRPGKT